MDRATDNGNMPAMPFLPTQDRHEKTSGLTKREQFAMAAMQGSLAGDINDELTIEDIAIQSRQIADALLKELEANNG